MTKPTKDQLCKLIDPMTRLYIDAAVEAACAPVLKQLQQLATERQEWITKAKARLDQLEVQQKSLFARYQEDDKFVLTKPKIVRLCKELGIE